MRGSTVQITVPRDSSRVKAALGSRWHMAARGGSICAISVSSANPFVIDCYIPATSPNRSARIWLG